MAEIPNTFGVRRIGRAAGAIVRDDSGIITGRAVANLGQGIEQFAAAQQERVDRFAYAKAKSALLRADLEARAELEQDQDYATHEKRYGERMSKARDEAIEVIGNQSDRVIFEEESKIDLERGTLAVRERARGIETDKAMADLGELLESNRAAALQAKDEATRSAVIKASIDAINGARAQYGERFSEVDAAKMRHNWTHDYAEGYVAMLPAGERVRVLTSPDKTPAAFLQPDERAKLLKAAQDEDKELVLRAKSQDASDSIMEKFGGDRGQALAEARKIEDPEVRDAVNARINARFAEIAQIDAERNDNAFDAAATAVEQSGSVDGIDVRTWQTVLTQPQRVALEQRAKQLRNGEDPVTDVGRWYELRQEAADDPAGFAKRNLMLDRHLLADSDFKGLAEIQAAIRDGSPKADQLLSGVRTATQVVDDTLRQIGIDPSPKPGTPAAEQVAQFSRAVDEQVTALQHITGHKATSEEVQSIVDHLAVKGTVPGSAFFGLFSSRDDKFAFEVEPGEEFKVSEADSVPAEDRRKIEAALRRRGRSATDADIVDLYNKKLASIQ